MCKLCALGCTTAEMKNTKFRTAFINPTSLLHSFLFFSTCSFCFNKEFFTYLIQFTLNVSDVNSVAFNCRSICNGSRKIIIIIIIINPHYLLCVYICVYVLCMHICMYTCVRVWMCACTHVGVYLCMEVCICITYARVTCVCVCVYGLPSYHV
jgi:hypothetical protein